MTLMTSRRRMIIFCPKNDSSPLLSLNRSWFTDPTSLRRSHAFGFPFELVCSVCRLRKFIRQHLSCLVYLVGESRIRIVDNEDGYAEVIYHVQYRSQQSQHVLHLIPGRAEVQSPLHLGKPRRKIYYDVTRGRVAEKDISHRGLDLSLLATEQDMESGSRKVQVHYSDPMMKR